MHSEESTRSPALVHQPADACADQDRNRNCKKRVCHLPIKGTWAIVLLWLLIAGQHTPGFELSILGPCCQHLTLHEVRTKATRRVILFSACQNTGSTIFCTGSIKAANLTAQQWHKCGPNLSISVIKHRGPMYGLLTMLRKPGIFCIVSIPYQTVSMWKSYRNDYPPCSEPFGPAE